MNIIQENTDRLPVSLRLSTRTGRDHRRSVIVIENRLNGTHICEVQFTIDMLGELLAGGTAHARAFLTPGAVGGLIERRTDWVPFGPSCFSPFAKGDEVAAAEQSVRALEVDGWKADWDNLGNHHRSSVRDGVRGVIVTLSRLCEAQEALSRVFGRLAATPTLRDGLWTLWSEKHDADWLRLGTGTGFDTEDLLIENAQANFDALRDAAEVLERDGVVKTIRPVYDVIR